MAETSGGFVETPINERRSINSHTKTEYGVYDDEPFPSEGNAYHWYIRAVYWKREAHRNEGVQTTMNFEGKSGVLNGQIFLNDKDRQLVKDFMTPQNGGGFTNKINAIKHVRDATGCGLKEAKDFVDAGDF